MTGGQNLKKGEDDNMRGKKKNALNMEERWKRRLRPRAA